MRPLTVLPAYGNVTNHSEDFGQISFLFQFSQDLYET